MRVQKRYCFAVFMAFVILLCAASPALALVEMPETPIGIGARGAQVQLLQSNLVELSFLDAAHADGEYNAFTIIAVHKLQQMLSLPADGWFDKSTAAAFNEYIKKGADKPLEGYKIGIDPGHQKVADNRYEAVAPGSERTKERMSPGCVGVKSGVYEYEIVLLVSNKLKKLLEGAGATVIMARTTNDVSISNAERAQMMNKSDVDYWVRVHCDYSSKRKQVGAYALSPSKSLAPDIYENSLELSKYILTEFCKSTQAKRNTVELRSDQTGMNWSKSPVTTIEMGYLSNPAEDTLLNKESYQALCAKGIFNGILAYAEAYPKQ